MSIVLQGSTSGSITLQEPAIAGSTTINLPATTGTALVAPTALTVPNTTGTVMVSGNMPAFSAYPSVNQSVSNATWTKMTFDTEEYDTNNNFASSRFTPTVAGYYQINARVVANGYTTSQTILTIYKNGSESSGKRLQQIPNGTASSICPMGSALIYMNGSTDYLEIYLRQDSGTSQTFLGSYSAEAWFQGFLVRAA